MSTEFNSPCVPQSRPVSCSLVGTNPVGGLATVEMSKGLHCSSLSEQLPKAECPTVLGLVFQLVLWVLFANGGQVQKTAFAC
jgi:hypothetical protein